MPAKFSLLFVIILIGTTTGSVSAAGETTVSSEGTWNAIKAYAGEHPIQAGATIGALAGGAGGCIFPATAQGLLGSLAGPVGTLIGTTTGVLTAPGGCLVGATLGGLAGGGLAGAIYLGQEAKANVFDPLMETLDSIEIPKAEPAG
ncbi:MAG: hypothetical protein AAB425_01990 [Bdellovibrionota bacterium]